MDDNKRKKNTGHDDARDYKPNKTVVFPGNNPYVYDDQITGDALRVSRQKRSSKKHNNTDRAKQADLGEDYYSDTTVKFDKTPVNPTRFADDDDVYERPKQRYTRLSDSMPQKNTHRAAEQSKRTDVERTKPEASKTLVFEDRSPQKSNRTERKDKSSGKASRYFEVYPKQENEQEEYERSAKKVSGKARNTANNVRTSRDEARFDDRKKQARIRTEEADDGVINKHKADKRRKPNDAREERRPARQVSEKASVTSSGSAKGAGKKAGRKKQSKVALAEKKKSGRSQKTSAEIPHYEKVSRPKKRVRKKRSSEFTFMLPRLPKISPKIYKIIGISIAAAACLIICVLGVRFVFSVRVITVMGETSYSYEEVIAFSELELGQCMFDIDEREVENVINENNPFIIAKVSKGAVSKITLTVSEREVYASIACSNGYVLIDENGLVLEIEAQDARIKEGSIMVEGMRNRGYLLGKYIGNVNTEAKVNDLMKLLDAVRKSRMNHRIIRVDLTNSNSIICYTVDGFTAKVGDIENIDVKLQRIDKYADKLLEQGLGKGIMDVSSGVSYELAEGEDDANRPDDTLEPEGTQEPDDTPEPEDTQEPDDTPEPQDTQEPDDTPEPEGTQEPDDTPEPEGTQEPDDTPEPQDTQEPEDTPNPDETEEP